ncbi:response regulator [Pontibacter sp. G13]|uniref:response regulator n=1 Tax=Pontibacter sp. G13 TaxID=3074898 RepID=UPI00288BA6A8|nr:response regulator [Pontibacter sp. G13]WNJ16946.1 response regulator [Pontibacter sp. G13]
MNRIKSTQVDAPALRILVVEDNDINQLLAKKILSMLGHQIDLAENGLAAVDAARKVSYHLILMDIRMPEMDGLEATQVIRRGFGGDHQPMIFAMTALDSEEDEDQCLTVGMDGFLTKPLSVSHLREKLAECKAHFNLPAK